ncbi:MAG: hypothetical protein Fur0046_04430 [Cyanobacteria bacterium J069]|nr:MAG: hypothetical protein D6742_01475 [Cyanobacteria bacterium J069]
MSDQKCGQKRQPSPSRFGKYDFIELGKGTQYIGWVPLPLKNWVGVGRVLAVNTQRSEGGQLRVYAAQRMQPSRQNPACWDV